jgi:hypothetical protein
MGSHSPPAIRELFSREPNYECNQDANSTYPRDVFMAIRDMTADELEQLRVLLETARVEYDSEHELPASFVRELREALVEVEKGHVEPFDFSS